MYLSLCVCWAHLCEFGDLCTSYRLSWPSCSLSCVGLLVGVAWSQKKERSIRWGRHRPTRRGTFVETYLGIPAVNTDLLKAIHQVAARGDAASHYHYCSNLLTYVVNFTSDKRLSKLIAREHQWQDRRQDSIAYSCHGQS